MTSAWTNLSFAIMHRNIEREWGNQCGLEIVAHPQKSYTSAKYCGMMRRPNIYFQFIIALELGENEQWSSWSMVHMEDCSLGLLHSFWFCHTFDIVKVLMRNAT
ncbi:hypothetical protein SADUNF_Sadunf12G0006800 [Salix dunnii]|uniref:Uncharacterized protein n=1 Tax=Salix dunnii TaxID=1413687 RepID=A0A835JIT1_9ROSI|nr:hypothetical protein SADUNF_Sadunf12G0006800 [Salix dunnii]